MIPDYVAPGRACQNYIEKGGMEVHIMGRKILAKLRLPVPPEGRGNRRVEAFITLLPMQSDSRFWLLDAGRRSRL